MSFKTRLRAAERAARSRPARSVLAEQWPCSEPPGLREKYRCPAFDGAAGDYSALGGEAEYHWTLSELKAEAERRGVDLDLIEFYDYGGAGRPVGGPDG